ncbi:glycoside hydrolase [Streptomyces katrae]|uniref:glycoside hydrolase n=1 Tax=Streptomyces katrae TaxID=68223 RepID=UPI001F33B2F0|nr:glycoside hydrolase [Streptomyces katrae]
MKRLTALTCAILLALTSQAVAAPARHDIDFRAALQPIDGFGFSKAFQRADLLHGARGLSPAKQREVLDLLLSEDKGAGLSILRLGIGSSTDRVYDHMPTILPADPGGPDATPKYVWDGWDGGQVWLAKEAKAYGVTRFFADAWSAPAFMKTNGSENDGGELRPAWRQAYANYLVQYAKFYRQEGIEITDLGFTNEPFLWLLASVGRITMNLTRRWASGTGCLPNGLGDGEQHELVASVPAGLGAPVGRACGPWRARGPACPRCGDGLAGNSPRHDPLVVCGHTWPTPYPVSEGAPADRRRGRVVAGDDGGLRLLLERLLPVLAAPAGGIGRIDRDDDESGVVGHAAQALPEACGRQTGDGAAERLAAIAASHGFAAGGPGVVEAEVLDRDTGAAVPLGEGDQFGDRGSQAAVALGCGAGQVGGHGDRLTDGIAGRVHDADGEMAGIEVHGQQPDTGSGQLDRGGGHCLLGGPGCVEVPAAAFGVVGDVVADGPVGDEPVQPLLAPVVEGDGAGEAVAAARRVGEVPQRFGQDNGDRAVGRVHADRVVPVRCTRLPVGGQEHAGRVPPLPPPGPGETGVGQVVPHLRQPTAAHHDRRMTGLDTRFHLGQAGGEHLQPALLLRPLRLVRVAAHSTHAPPARHRQTLTDLGGSPAQGRSLIEQAPQGELVLILAGAGDRTRPPG